MNEKVSSLIKKYRNVSGDFDDNRKFIFNSKNLLPNLNVVEAQLNNNALIFVIETGQVKA